MFPLFTGLKITMAGPRQGIGVHRRGRWIISGKSDFCIFLKKKILKTEEQPPGFTRSCYAELPQWKLAAEVPQVIGRVNVLSGLHFYLIPVSVCIFIFV
jgi:hypothetical protein